MITRGVYKSKCKTIIEATDFDTLDRAALRKRLINAAQNDQHFFEQYKLHDFAAQNTLAVKGPEPPAEPLLNDKLTNLEKEIETLRIENSDKNKLCAQLQNKLNGCKNSNIKIRHDLRAFRIALETTVNYVTCFIDLNHILRTFDMMVVRWNIH